MEAKYCVYGHYGDEGICFYVGIGDRKRPYTFIGRSRFWENYVKKHCSMGKPEVAIWHSALTWNQAVEHEKFWVAIYGRRDIGTGALVNLTDGGEGMANPSRETRKKISEANKGSKNPNWGKPSYNSGKPASRETCKKISEALKGEKHPLWRKQHSEETRRRIAEANKGRVLSKETRQKIAKAAKEQIISKETRQKMAMTRRGKEKGYSFHKQSNKYRARIQIKGKQKYLGLFLTEVEARSAYEIALANLPTGK